MSNYHADDVEYRLLQAIADHMTPVGAGFLADLFAREDDLALSEATIGRYLRRFEQKGYLKSEKYDGRSRGRTITPEGRERVRELTVGRSQAKAVEDVMEMLRNGGNRHLRHMLVTREIVEPAVAALAAQNATAGDIAAIREIVDEMTRLTKEGKSMAATDGPFHVAIAKASGNPILESVVRMIRTDRDYSPEIEYIINASAARMPSDHWEIYTAIEERRPEEAWAIMQRHIRNIIEQIDAYEKNGAAPKAGR